MFISLIFYLIDLFLAWWDDTRWLINCRKARLGAIRVFIVPIPLVYVALTRISNTVSLNIILNHSMRIWARFRKHFGLWGTYNLSPIKSNHSFIPFCTDPAFTLWFNKGIRSIHNLFIGDKFALSYIYNRTISPVTDRSVAFYKTF